ncbi:MAG: flagellar protein FlaG [Spirochaetia bacterium]|nr:flagellar protein FlaG [Treponema sp.]MCI6316884.1 flagellar protein FlaG [Spirochaetia bacterium]MBR0545897.1 flagellar protein FlaG [Treponema sp.]MCI6365771.1 flagellar protein FlaG [Spirochaetia bacterium]MCI6545595.1 flagellar protein FlaG [Spirochaetia bacterium]
MNTINSYVQSMTTDGHNLHTNAYQQGKSDSAVNRINEKTLSTPTAAEVAADMVQNAAETKADAVQLQKMSDLVSARKVLFNVNDELGSVVVKIVDPNTEQVLKEIPSKDIQNLKIRIRKTIGILFDDLV